ncbi:rolling circle replication-associated protein [Vibrio sonorensis]|uniref:rolling circle replication-associated protein n=1 Tax=Vibrio sonorensis TaxID=1004316 RepID=UPI0008D94774|nr:hypothetical protein [Vibrio sonorensis]
MNHLYEQQGERKLTNILSPQDVGYITALAQDVATTEKNIAAIESGFFSAPNSDWLQSEQNKLRAAEQIHSLKTKEQAEIWQLVQDGKLTLITPQYFKEPRREAHAVGVEKLGLSKGGKVRHDKHKHLYRFITRSRRLKPRTKTESVYVEPQCYGVEQAAPQTGWVRDSERKRLDYIPHKGMSRAYLLKRDWSNQVKLQVTYHPSPSEAPQAQTGERYTHQLSNAAVKKIFESGAYVAACHGGFSTFLTLTFDDFQRAKLFATDSNVHLTSEGNEFSPLSDDMAAYSPLQITIGNEISRFLDAAKRIYHRGFGYKQSQLSGQANIEFEGDDVKVSGHYKPVPLMGRKSKTELVGPARGKADFHYIWVAECPTNEHGQPNPHVHILLNWQVAPEHFQAWAKRIERLWGHGLAHLERIKHKDAAAGYLIKAVGYAAKGGNADQGMIKGNRYNIARCSRAPDWEALASFDVHNITGIIKECGYRLEQWKAPIKRNISRKQYKKSELKKAVDINKHKRNIGAVVKLNRLIKLLDEEIWTEKERLNSRGVFASSLNQFSISFEGDNYEQKANQFLEWAAGARGWSMQTDDLYIDDIRLEAKERYKQAFKSWQLRQAEWANQLAQDMPPMMPEEIYHELRNQSISEAQEYYQLH